MIKRKLPKPDKKKEEVVDEDKNVVKLYFDPAHYTVMENVGQFAVKIVREGDLSKSIAVDFKTEDGTATSGSDFVGIDEPIIFASNEACKEVSEQIFKTCMIKGQALKRSLTTINSK